MIHSSKLQCVLSTDEWLALPVIHPIEPPRDDIIRGYIEYVVEAHMEVCTPKHVRK